MAGQDVVDQGADLMLAIDLLHEVDHGELPRTSSGQDNDGETDQDHLARLGTDVHFEVSHRLAAPGHIDQRAVLTTELIAEEVDTAEDQVAALAEHVWSGMTEQCLGSLVPDGDAPGFVGGECGGTRTADHFQLVGQGPVFRGRRMARLSATSFQAGGSKIDRAKRTRPEVMIHLALGRVARRQTKPV